MAAFGSSKVKGAAKKVTNTHRREARKARYQANLRRRAIRGDERAIRLLDTPRTRAGKNAIHCVSFPRCIHVGRQ